MEEKNWLIEFSDYSNITEIPSMECEYLFLEFDFDDRYGERFYRKFVSMSNDNDLLWGLDLKTRRFIEEGGWDVNNRKNKTLKL